MRGTRSLYFALILTVSITAAAQPATCPALVAQALAAVSENCGGIGRNEACYGNIRLNAVPREDTALEFNSPGDTVSVTDVQSFQLAELAPDVPEWGVAVMALQANLPDSLPGQNVTVVLFGDVAIENADGETKPPPDVFVTGNNVNVRQSPSTSASIVGTVGATAQRVVGRLTDGSWLRVALEDGIDGWVSASVVTVNGDESLVPESLPDDAPPAPKIYGPMQAFRLRTGIGVPACIEAPASGIVIQTPDGAGEIQFEINQVTVTLGSTAVVRAAWGDAMRFSLAEGTATLQAESDDVVRISPGETAIVPLDAVGTPSGEIIVEPATPEDLNALPVALLPRELPPIVEGENPTPGGTVVRAGRWAFQSSGNMGSCVAGVSDNDSGEVVINPSPDGSFILMDLTFVPGADGLYVATINESGEGFSVLAIYELTFSGDVGSGHVTVDMDVTGQAPCSVEWTVDMQYLGE